MDRASFDLLFRPEILVVMTGQDTSVAPVSGTDGPSSRTAVNTSLFPSNGGCKIDRGSRGVGFPCPFSRFDYAGQDVFSEKTDLFFRPVINLVIPIAPVVPVFRPFMGLFFVARRSLQGFSWLLRHAANLAREFEHDVVRKRASRCQIEIGAGSRE